MSIIRYREELAERIVGLIAEQNGGELPAHLEEWESCFKAFGKQVRWIEPEILPEPLIRGKIVFVPDRRPAGRRLIHWLAHELAEVVLAWEGTPRFQGPGWSQDRHRIARLVEQRLAG